MKPQTAYILGEVEHLLFCGAAPEYIWKVLNTTPGAISKLAYRNGKPELAKPFNNKQKEK